MNKKVSKYSRVHRGNSRQVSNKLSAVVCAEHNNSGGRHDTRVGNPLFRASRADIEEYRAKRQPQPQK